MTGPDSSKPAGQGAAPEPSQTQPAPTPALPTQPIDGKYQVLRELSRAGNVTLYEVRAAEGVTRRVAWFEVQTPAERQSFHAYRTALRTAAPAGLTDVVARPGAYYAVWQDVPGTPLAEVAAQPTKRQEMIEAVEALGARLADAGFALSDADIVLQGDQPQVAYLRPVAPRTPEQIATLNAGVLGDLRDGKVKRKRERRPGAWLTFVPGLVFLAGASWLGAQAAKVYLNPPVGEVSNVISQPAADAARALTKKGFRVEYAYGENGNQPIGVVIRQEPDGGTSLPTGRLVVLTVNKPAPLTVPKVEDMTLTQAQGPLGDSALKLGKVIRVDGTQTRTPEGRIIAQIPPAGASTQRSVPVQVLVSTGVRSEETFIPDLRGMTFEQARDWARAAGLVVTDWSREPSDKTENTVLSQEPAPWANVTVGSKVKLVIAGVRTAPPSVPTEPLPIPPPYVPPPPPEPITAPEQTPPTQGQPSTQPGTQPGTTPAPDTAAPPAVDTTPRQVNLNYTFPAELPAGIYSITVQDASGEREIMPGVPAGQVASRRAQAPIQVQGNAVFIIRRNGAEYARVPVQ
ncbi:PASTA domain-containing protein [Deinococcus sp. PESE-13]